MSDPIVIVSNDTHIGPRLVEDLRPGKSTKVGDQELLGVGFQIYNRWLADFVSQAPHRHIGLAHLPVWDVGATVAEVEWAHEAGLRGVNLPAMRDGLQPEYNKRLWEPLWAVYVATPHSRHEADTLLAVEAGKHVLCEKPFALNGTQARRMADAASAAGVFCMEAMWTRFLPSYRVLVDVLGEDRIGDPILVEADFGFRTPVDPTHRHFDPDQGGGALLDLGIYPLQLCTLVLGRPDRVVADGVVGETGVDELVTAVTHHPGDGVGIAKAALRVGMSCEARIAGTDGWIALPAFMHCPLSLDIGGQHVDAPFEGEGLRFQVEEVHRCVADGRLESDVMPLDETVALAETMDDIRRRLGVTYPGE